MENKKLIKITLEFEDEIKILDGEQASDWLETINGMCVTAQVRGQNPFETKEFNWNIINK